MSSNSASTPKFLGVKDVARELGVTRQKVTDVLYRGCLSDDSAPIVSGRRLIRREDLPTIRQALHPSTNG